MIDTLISFLKSIDIYEELQFWFETTEIESLVKELQQGQLNEGNRGDNTKITPEYTPYTKVLKRAKGQPSDRVTLKDRGDFWESITTSPTDRFVEIYATDYKTNDLLAKYGEEILGLNENNISILQEKFKDYIISKILNS
jgi:hypothetical protein